MSFTKILGSGISTETNLHVGVITATKFIGDGSELLNVTSGVGIQSGGSSVGSGITFLNFIGTGNTFALRGDVLDISISSGIIGINTAGISTFKDLNVSGNVSIAGTLTYEDVKNVDSIGLITARSGIHVGTGITFTEDLVVDGDARITGILTIGTSSLTLDGSNDIVQVGSALTLGHTQGIQFYTQSLHSGGFEVNNINASGVVTATSFEGDGSALTGISAGLGTPLSLSNPLDVVYYTDNSLSIGATITIDVPNGANTNVSYSAYSDIILQEDVDLIIADGDDFIPDVLGLGDLNQAQHLIGSGGRIRANTITDKTATSGPNFPYGLSGVGIHSAGTVIHSGIITALNFIGAGNTFAVNGTTVDISIAGGGGGGGSGTAAGSNINYPSGSTSPFVLSSVHVTESITLDDSNADTVPSNVITGESVVTVDEGVTVTIEEGKTVIPDLYNVLSDTYTIQ